MNPIRKLHLCSLVLILTLLLSRTQLAIAITIDELADICEVTESAIIDIYVEYEFGVEPQSTIDDIKDTSDIITLGPCHEKWATKRPFSERSFSSRRGKYMNEDGDTFEQTMMNSYNGKIAKYFSTGGLTMPTGEQVNFSRGTITNSTRFIPPPNVTPISFSVFRLRYTDSEKKFLSEHLRKKEFVRLLDSVEKANGFNAICIELLWDAPSVPIIHKQQAQHRIYFSVDHGYTPIKYEDLSPSESGPEINFSVNVTSLEKVSDNLWFPSKGYLKQVGSGLINTYKATKIVVNQGLTDDYFDIKFPPGTRITNEISGLSYVSEAPEGQNDTGAKSTIHDSKPAIEDQRPQTPADTHESTKTIIYISIAGVIVLLIALTAKKYV